MSEQKSYHPNLNIPNIQTDYNQKNQYSVNKNDNKEF